MGEMEDEFHFVLVCPAFLDIREKYIKPYYYRKPSFFKFVQLFSKDNFKSTQHETDSMVAMYIATNPKTIGCLHTTHSNES